METNRELVGVTALRGRDHLYYLFVATRYHRCGLAWRLWTTVREACSRAGNDGPITVNSSTYAVPVYERLGFKRNGQPETAHGVEHHPMIWSPECSQR